jgi:hypothetical protein
MDANTPTDLLFNNEVFQIQGAVFDVRRTMGGGFLEAVYQERLALEFGASAFASFRVLSRFN